MRFERLALFGGIIIGLLGERAWGHRALRSQTRELQVLRELMMFPAIHSTDEVVRHITRTMSDALSASVAIVLVPRTQTRGLESNAIESNASREVTHVVGVDEREYRLALPLEAQGRRLGTLVVSGNESNRLSHHDERLAEAFAAQASVLLERSLLYEEVAAGAVLAERSRLAREIHDGLAQHLAFLKMRVAWLKRSPATVDAGQLEDIEGVLGTALAEARYAITTLRSTAASMTAADAVVTYAEEFGRISGQSVAISRDDWLPNIGPRTRVELLRIVQEALNNVRKHAQASSVQVSVVRSDDGVTVRIVDDGSGFIPAEGRGVQFGTEIMRERAESVGGSLRITSTPGVGTEVVIWVPGQGEEANRRRSIG